MLMAIFARSSTLLKAWLVNWADSTGRRNTGFCTIARNWSRASARVFQPKVFTMPGVHGVSDDIKFISIMLAEIGSFPEILPQRNYPLPAIRR